MTIPPLPASPSIPDLARRIGEQSELALLRVDTHVRAVAAGRTLEAALAGDRELLDWTEPAGRFNAAQQLILAFEPRIGAADKAEHRHLAFGHVAQRLE